MRRLVVTVEAGEHECKACRWADDRKCHLFRVPLGARTAGGDRRRAAECVAAEQKETGR